MSLSCQLGEFLYFIRIFSHVFFASFYHLAHVNQKNTQITIFLAWPLICFPDWKDFFTKLRGSYRRNSHFSQRERMFHATMKSKSARLKLSSQMFLTGMAFYHRSLIICFVYFPEKYTGHGIPSFSKWRHHLMALVLRTVHHTLLMMLLYLHLWTIIHLNFPRSYFGKEWTK